MADLEFYKSTVNEFDPSSNGGDITIELIESGVLHSLLLAVRPATAENGGERWFKYFVKATVDAMSLGFDIAKVSSSLTEDVYISLAGSDEEVESDLDKSNIRVYGGFVVSAFDSATKTVTTDRDTTEFIKSDDKVTFYDADSVKVVSWFVKSVTETEIVFKDISSDNVSGLSASSTLQLDSLLVDTYQGFWIKQIIPAFTETMEVTPNEFIFGVWYDLV